MLFVNVGSGVEFVTLAKLVNTPVAGAVTIRVKFVEPPLASVAIVGHVTAPLLLVPPLLALKNATPSGSESVVMTFVAVEGPAFVTVMV